MRARPARVALAVAALAAAARSAPAVADDPTTSPATAPAPAAVDKSAYTLFHPVPDDQQRAFNPDRPSTTTGPFTVDAGHVQLEASFAQYTHDRSAAAAGGDGGYQVSAGPAEVRVGLTEHTEVDLTLMPFLYQHTPAAAGVAAAPTTGSKATRGAASPAYASGFGDLQLQAKLNLLGDDGGDVAFAIVPYLTLPTASATKGLGTGRAQGGVILPAQANLPADFVLAGQVEFDFPRNDADTTTGFDVLHTVELSHPIAGPLDAFGEYVGVAPVRLGHGYQAYANTGLTYQIGDNLQLDAAVDLGLSRDTPRYTIQAGITVRR